MAHRKLSHRLMIEKIGVFPLTDYTNKLLPNITKSHKLEFDTFGIEQVEFKFTLQGENLNENLSKSGLSISYYIEIDGIEYLLFTGNSNKDTSIIMDKVEIQAIGALNYQLSKQINVINNKMEEARLDSWFNIFTYGSGAFTGGISTMNDIIVAEMSGGSILDNIKPLLYPYHCIANYDFSEMKGYIKSSIDLLDLTYIHTFALSDWEAMSIDAVKLSTSEYPSSLNVKGSEMQLLAYCDDGETFGIPVGYVFNAILTGKEIKELSTTEIEIDSDIYTYAYLDGNFTFRDSDDIGGTIISLDVNIDKIYVNEDRKLIVKITNNTGNSVYLKETQITVNDKSRTPWFDISRVYKKTNVINVSRVYDVNSSNILTLESNSIQNLGLANNLMNYKTIMRRQMIKFTARAYPNLKLGDKIRIELTKDNFKTILLTEIEEIVNFSDGYQAEYKGIDIGDIRLTDYLIWGVTNWGTSKWF